MKTTLAVFAAFALLSPSFSAFGQSTDIDAVLREQQVSRDRLEAQQRADSAKRLAEHTEQELAPAKKWFAQGEAEERAQEYPEAARSYARAFRVWENIKGFDAEDEQGSKIFAAQCQVKLGHVQRELKKFDDAWESYGKAYKFYLQSVDAKTTPNTHKLDPAADKAVGDAFKGFIETTLHIR